MGVYIDGYWTQYLSMWVSVTRVSAVFLPLSVLEMETLLHAKRCPTINWN